MPAVNYEARYATLRARRELRNTLLKVFKEQLENSGLKRNTFCQMIGLNTKSLWSIERGDGEKVSLDTMVLYLLRLGVQVDVSVKPLERAHDQPVA